MNDNIYEQEETALVLVPVPITEAGELIDRLGSSGYDAVQFRGIEDVLKALGMEPVETEGVDFEIYESLEAILKPYASSRTSRGETQATQWKLLACIGLALTDLAKTHKRAMPPLL